MDNERASEASDSRLHIFDVVGSFTRTRSNSADKAGVLDVKHQDLAVVRSSPGLVSQIFVLDVLPIRWEVIVFAKQSESVTDVSTQRE